MIYHFSKILDLKQQKYMLSHTLYHSLTRLKVRVFVCFLPLKRYRMNEPSNIIKKTRKSSELTRNTKVQFFNILAITDFSLIIIIKKSITIKLSFLFEKLNIKQFAFVFFSMCHFKPTLMLKNREKKFKFLGNRVKWSF